MLWGDIVPASWAYDASAVVTYKQDVAKAKSLLTEAGWTVGADGVATRAGKKFVGKIRVRAGKPQRIKAAQIISDQLKAIGMQLTPDPTDFKVFYKPIQQGDFDVAIAGFGLTVDPDDYTTFSSSQLQPEHKSGNNWTGYSNPQLDTLIDQLETDGGPALWEMSPDDARALSAVMGAMDDPPEVAAVEDRVIPGPAGDLPVRIYTPDAPSPRPVVAFFHGGGFVICSVETHDGLARRLANALGAVVVSVEYRLAPEARCPAAAEDCYAATQWIHEHATELGADPARLMVAGDSAGGNLAAVVSLMAREQGGPPIMSQVLVYPVIDAACDTPSYTENAEGYFLTAPGMHWFWAHYLGPDGDGTHQNASPIRASDLSGLPPAVVQLRAERFH